MRVIEADDVEAEAPPFPPGLDVILRVDQKSIGIRGKISRPAGLGDAVGRSKQQAAALGRCSLARMGDDGVERGPTDDHRASMTIAMPMPPPMHNDATP